MSGFIAVHVGAGYHSETFRPLYIKACKDACNSATALLTTGCSATEAVTEAVSVLEDCPITNAGVGSNLTLNGTIECDAGVIDGDTLHFGSVGALSNIRNPVKVANRVLDEQKKGLLSCGRVPPCTIVGKGAMDWALTHGFQLVDAKSLTTNASVRTFSKNLQLLESSTSPIRVMKGFDENKLLDTVGAVCVDSAGNLAAAVSSGGLLLKHTGRIGQATVYGAGCWAQNSPDKDKPGIATSVTGVGEYLIKTLFAKECYRRIYDKYDSISALPDVFRNHFLESPYLKNIADKLAGVLALKYYPADRFCELAWAHNTKSMILGYSNGVKKPISVISLQPEGALYGKSIVGGEKCIKLAL